MELVSLDLLAHTCCSLFIGIIFWKLFGEQKKQSLFFCLFFAFLNGLFIDVDHFFDYFHAYGFVWNMQDFFAAKYFAQTGYNFVFFHGFEYVMLLAFSAYFIKNKNAKLYLIILATSLFIHLMIDIFVAGVMPHEYFILYRLAHGFHGM